MRDAGSSCSRLDTLLLPDSRGKRLGEEISATDQWDVEARVCLISIVQHDGRLGLKKQPLLQLLGIYLLLVLLLFFPGSTSP